MSSNPGVIDRDEGADLVYSGFNRGRTVEHISHDRSEGWLRNVQAGHAIELCLESLREVAVKEAEAEDGSEDERF